MNNSFLPKILCGLISAGILAGTAYSQAPVNGPGFPYSESARSDSLRGFDVATVWRDLTTLGIDTREASAHLNFLKRQFIKNKYYATPRQTAAPSSPIPGRSKAGNPAIAINGTPCVNEGFESTSPGAYTTATAVTGWTVESSQRYWTCLAPSVTWTAGSPDFSIHSTPLTNVPQLGFLPHSPLGGTRIAQINDYAAGDYSATKLSQTFPVTSGNSLFRFAFAGLLHDAVAHTCCQQPDFIVQLKDCSGVVHPCKSLSLTPTSSCTGAPNTYSYSSNYYWTSWQIRQIDLTAFVGSCVTIEFIALDCALGGHISTVFLDTECSVQNSLVNCTNCINLGPASPVSYCTGGPAVIQAPLGYATYLWSSAVTGTLSTPSPSMSAITLANPIPNSVYSVSMTTPSGCTYISSYTLTPTQVGISAIGSAGTCSSGATGSATVLATGSGSGYNYVWTNASNSVISTASVASNLSQGSYTVMVASQNSSLCGTAAASFAIGFQQPATQFYTKPFCNGVAILNTPPGSNHRWFIGNTLISTNAIYTPANPTPGQVYRVGYTGAQGCRDSIVYLLQAATPGSVTLASNPVVCEGATNGAAAFSLSPSGNQVPGTVGYTVVSLGQTPSFNFTVNNSTSNSFTVPGLAAGGSYSLLAFDGSCYASSSFTTGIFYTSNLFTVTSVWSPTLCQGSSVPLGVAFSGSTSPGQYTFSWSPSSAVAPTNAPNVLATPSAPPGSAAVIIYSVTVTPTVINCPSTGTIAALVSHPVTPTITSPGVLCTNQNPFQVNVAPSNGVFVSGAGSGLNASGLLTPSAAIPGVYTFSYVSAVNNCSLANPASYTMLPGPALSVSGNTSICSGQSTTLTASGAQMYFWPGVGTSAQVVVSPLVTTSFVVTGSSGNGCNASQMVMVLVTPTPTLSVSSNTTICAGESTTLIAGGADLYLWSNNVSSAQNVVAPTSTSIYTVVGTNLPGLCSDMQTVTVTALPLPLIFLNGPHSVCAGDLVEITAAGAQNYLWNGAPGGGIFTTTLQAYSLFVVTGTDQNGCSNTSTIAILVDDCTELPKEHATRQVQLYPNPVADQFFVALPIEAEVTIYDALGKLIFRKNLNAGLRSVNLASFSEGTYYVQVRSTEGVFVKRLVKRGP